MVLVVSLGCGAGIEREDVFFFPPYGYVYSPSASFSLPPLRRRLSSDGSTLPRGGKQPISEPLRSRYFVQKFFSFFAGLLVFRAHLRILSRSFRVGSSPISFSIFFSLLLPFFCVFSLSSDLPLRVPSFFFSLFSRSSARFR